jgi:hypothetical protein
VRVLRVLDDRIDDHPTLAELRRLFAIVRPKVLVPFDDHNDEEKPQRGFNCCFRWISNQYRAPAPSSKHSLTFWLDCAKSWLRERNVLT